METSDIVLTFVSILTAITGGVAKWIVKELGKLNTKIENTDNRVDGCQINLNREFVRKSDYIHQIDKIESKLDKIIDALGKR
ncbi:MAG: hypothetical protein HON94_06545 [Methylococcales bacterium]|jgi:hypothetical protein|nr:hypothetical protein [Methylococcales bacterium]